MKFAIITLRDINPSDTYMYRHVEVVSLEGICHLTKTLQSILLCSLLKAKSFRGTLTLLRREKKKKRKKKEKRKKRTEEKIQ